MKYKIALHSTEESYSVSVPGRLPGCWSQAETETEALPNIQTRSNLGARDELHHDAEAREVEVAVNVCPVSRA